MRKQQQQQVPAGRRADVVASSADDAGRGVSATIPGQHYELYAAAAASEALLRSSGARRSSSSIRPGGTAEVGGWCVRIRIGVLCRDLAIAGRPLARLRCR